MKIVFKILRDAIRQKSQKFTKKGMTLVEILVSMTISAVIFSAVLISYSAILKSQQKADTLRQMQKEIHFAMARISDRIRAKSIDFEKYEFPEKCSGVNIASAEKLCVGGGDFFEKSGKSIKMNSQPLISDKFSVETAIFYTTPSDSTENLQPKTTIFLEVKSNSIPNLKMALQTTISSRIYKN